MRYLMMILVVSCVGCKHTGKRAAQTTSLVVPVSKEEKVDEKEKTRNITIQFMPIQNLTIKAI